MQTKIIERYFFFGLMLATLILIFFIFRPFLVVLLLGACFSIVLYPLYYYMVSKKLPAWISSFVTVFLFAIVVCGPLLGIGAMVFNQSANVYHKVVTDGSAKPFMDSVNSKVAKILPEGVSFDINNKVTSIVSYLEDNITNIFTGTVSALISFILMLVIMFFLLKNGENCKKAIVEYSPLAQENNEKLVEKLTQAVSGVIRGSLFIGIFQGIYVGFGFWMFGISNPALWGVIAGICSLIPPIGASLVSIPVIIYLFSVGQTAFAIGLFIWAIIMLAIIDSFLRPFLVGKKINIPSILILFSIMGGLSMFGAMGIIVGPLSLALLETLIAIYRNEFKD